MANKTQLKILSYLIDNKEKLLGIRELAKEISTAYYLVQRNIHQLKEKNIIQLQKAGKTHIITLSKEANSYDLIEAEAFKRELFFKKYPEIKVILKKIIKQAGSCFFVMLVFGSYTKNPRKDSDLDLLILVPDEKYSNPINNAISSVARTSPIEIHETILTEESFLSLSRKKELNVASESLNNHIIIYGSENFYKLQDEA